MRETLTLPAGTETSEIRSSLEETLPPFSGGASPHNPSPQTISHGAGGRRPMGISHVSERTREERKMVTITSAREYIDEQSAQGKTDREIFNGILELDGDVWHVVELVRDLGWSIGRFEASQIGDEFFRENQEYVRAFFSVADFPAASVEIDPT